MDSIRGRLLHALILTLLAIGIASALATFWTARSEINEILDGELQQVALSLRDHLDGHSVHNTRRDESERIIVQIWDECASSVYLSRPAPTLPTRLTNGFADIPYSDSTWRVFTDTVGCRHIQVAQPTSLRTQLAAASALKILQPILVLLPIIGIAVWVIVGRVLSSLDRTARAVACRKPDDVSPIESAGMPTEIKALVDAFNTLLARLTESLASQKQFASDAAHELRTPLAALKLRVQMAERAKTDEARARHFGKIEECISRATHLIEQLLTMTRLDPESAARHFERISLTQLGSSVCEDMAPVAAQKSITVQALCEENVWVKGAEPALRLLISNLTDNAIRYTPERGRIEIRIRRNRTNAIIEVADNGRGIAPEDRERVFERFFRAGSTDTQGTGLGLAIVRRVTTIHGGAAQIVDGLDGKGITVRITMPATTPENL